MPDLPEGGRAMGPAGKCIVILTVATLLAGCGALTGTADPSERRGASGATYCCPPETPETKRIREQLARPVTVEFDSTKFDEVIETFRRLSRVNILVDPKARLAQGITPDTTVKLKVKDIPLRSALTLALEEVNLDFVIRNGVIFVTSQWGARQHFETRFYDVRDLAAPVPGRAERAKRLGRGGGRRRRDAA